MAVARLGPEIQTVKSGLPSTPIILNYYLDTPGPGSYVLPSDFGYLEQPQKSPRGLTASTITRPRLAFKS